MNKKVLIKINKNFLISLCKNNFGENLDTHPLLLSADDVTYYSRSYFLVICIHFRRDGCLTNKISSLNQLGSEFERSIHIQNYR